MQLESDPTHVRALHYDLVLNGMEIAGGSIRIHDPALQTSVFLDHLKVPIPARACRHRARCGALMTWRLACCRLAHLSS